MQNERAFSIEDGCCDIENVRELFSEYTDMLGADLSFQHYDEELADLPGKYAPPDGRLFIAYVDGKAAGCCAIRKMDTAGCCELKRLFVRPEFREYGIGRGLMDRAEEEALAAGYGAIYLDTLERLGSAVRMYEKRGYERIEAYYENPLENVLYFRKKLI